MCILCNQFYQLISYNMYSCQFLASANLELSIWTEVTFLLLGSIILYVSKVYSCFVVLYGYSCFCVYNIAQNFHTNEHDELPTYLELLVATFVYYNCSSMSASTNILACFLSPKLDASMFPMLPCNRDMIHNYQMLASKFVHIKMLPILSCRTHLKKLK
jgi:hypothetical protein